jgi:hypothetical protein
MRTTCTIILLSLATVLHAQAPSDGWRTVTTAHFRVHYPRPYEAWSLRAASRLESVREAVVREVGFAPEQITDVVVENPFADANGITLPLLDTPRIVLFTEPPGPDIEIGDYSDWIDLLTVHEMTHLVHLLRPSRNHTQRMLARFVPLDPITFDGPRWVIEGYATVVEGRLTGSGRPTSSIRAAILRRWAQGGRLPSYGQLDSNRSFLGMSMAYLAGSAFLEWLEERGGPGSLRNLWARMTAKENRSFEQSFEGVFGDQPDRLYGRFLAELTDRAMAIDRAAAPQEGDLWQETTRRSGDPAVSPDGKQIAIVVRPFGKPSKIVVWSTEAPVEEEKQFHERIDRILRRDPEDIAPVRSGPLSRKPLHSLSAPDGGDLGTPRWTADGRSLIYTHRQPDRDGFLHHDLFRWTPERGTNERLTHLADVSDADPLPAGGEAIAVRNRFGYSQLVRVQLNSGDVVPLTEPSLDRVYTHPRVSADGSQVAFAMHDQSSWRLAIRAIGSGDERIVPNEARSNVAMPEWSRTNPNELYATVLSGGFIDLHRFGADDSNVAITRTNGAAFSPAASPDGRIFFMALERDGFVVRVIRPETPVSALPPIDRALAPALPPDAARAIPFAAGPLSMPRPYGLGRQELFWIAGGTYAPAGRTTEVGIRFGDVVGRFDTIAIAALGGAASPHGVALASAWRGWPVTITAHAFSARATDAPKHGIELRGSWAADAPREFFRIDAGALAGSLHRGFIETALDLHQLHGSTRIDEGVTAEADGAGGAGGASHIRGIGRASIRLGNLRLRARYQRDTASHPRDDFDRIALGGIATSVTPMSALATRVLDPALNSRTLLGNRYQGLRVEAASGVLTAFWQQHRLDGDRLSLAGLEVTASSEAIPLVKAPAFEATVGIARILDTHRMRAWLGVRWRP